MDANGWVKFGNGSFGRNHGGIDHTALGIKSEKIQARFDRIWYYWRPKVLAGIENNNGWIRVEDALPDDDKFCKVCVHGIPNIVVALLGSSVKKSLLHDFNLPVSHWKYAKEEKPPVY